nr:GNAT family N-acetyltransferase [uncultured Carboxylicivirga sp.]
MNIDIRPIQKSDYTHLIAMFKEFASFQKSADRMKNSVEQMEQESEYINGFVLETDNGEIIGYATYFYAYFTWTGKSLYMDDLYLKPPYRGNGYGQKLIESVIEKATVDNCKKVHWQVSGWNKNAINFYKKLGAIVDDTEMNCDYWIK